MPNTCEKCGTDLTDRAAFCPACGKAQSGMQKQMTTLPLQKRALYLPRNALSFISVILILAGAFARLIHSFLSFLNFDLLSLVIGNLTLVGAIFWFIANFSGMRLKIPILIWGCSVLLSMFSYCTTIRWYFENEYSVYGVYNSVFAILNISVVISAFLYSIYNIRRNTVLILIGIFIMVIIFTNLFFNISTQLGFSADTFELIYILTFFPGVFLSILSAKEKPNLQKRH